MQESPRRISWRFLCVCVCVYALSMMYQMIVIRIKINSLSECVLQCIYLYNFLYIFFFFILSTVYNDNQFDIIYFTTSTTAVAAASQTTQKLHLQQQWRPTEPRILYSNLFCVKNIENNFLNTHQHPSFDDRRLLCSFCFKNHTFTF